MTEEIEHIEDDESIRIINPMFLRIDNHLIALNRIVSIDYLPNALMYKVGESRYYDEVSAKEAARNRNASGARVEEIHTSIILINYKNAQDLDDFVRRNGFLADTVWNFASTILSVP